MDTSTGVRTSYSLYMGTYSRGHRLCNPNCLLVEIAIIMPLERDQGSKHLHHSTFC